MSYDLTKIWVCPECSTPMQVCLPAWIYPGPLRQVAPGDIDWEADRNKWYCPKCGSTDPPDDCIVPVKWADASIGDEVWVDNYQNGKYPQADPKISGPFTVAKGNGSGRWLEKNGRGFIHYPENLLRVEVDVPTIAGEVS